MKGTTIYFTASQFWDIMFALNHIISYYEEWENEILSFDPLVINDKTKDNTLLYVKENLKTFKSLKNKIFNKATKF